MWWAIETLTTVGYGDMVPVTAVGKLLGGLVSIVGIGTLALFSGVITVGFLDQLKHRREHTVTAESLTLERTVEAAKPSAELLDLRRWRITNVSMQADAAEQSRDVCPHCGHRLTIGSREPGQA